MWAAVITPETECPDLQIVPSLADKAAQAAAGFLQHFHRPHTWLAAAPGRVNVIGEHVDYCDGLVLPMAINRHVLMAAAPLDTPRLRLFSQATQETVEVALDQPQQRGEPPWANYVRGVVQGFLNRSASLKGLEVHIESDLPMGGGLSSSAALEVAMATLLEASAGESLTPTEIALLCQQAEHDFAGVPCGIMDQFTSVYGREGHLLLIDCRSHEVEPVRLHDPSVSMLVINTRVRHELGNSEYPLRRAQCEDAARRLGLESLRDATLEQVQAAGPDWPDPVQRRARHVVAEIARTRHAADAMAAGDWDRAGQLMYDSHASLRDDFEVSCKELDLVVRMAEALGSEGGVYGCRMTGGGFGGCCLALVRSHRAAEVARRIGAPFTAATGLPPFMFVSPPAAGAHLL